MHTRGHVFWTVFWTDLIVLQLIKSFYLQNGIVKKDAIKIHGF
jgi:hypothetical protein